MNQSSGEHTFNVPGEGGRTSRVASAGTPVSPALISPPSPDERLRSRGESLDVGFGREANLCGEVERIGKASDAAILRLFPANQGGMDVDDGSGSIGRSRKSKHI